MSGGRRTFAFAIAPVSRPEGSSSPAFEQRLGTRPWLLWQLRFIDDEAAELRKVVYELELLDQWRPSACGEAASLAGVVIPLHHAVSYQHIVAGLEPDAGWELDVTHEFLREALPGREPVQSARRSGLRPPFVQY